MLGIRNAIVTLLKREFVDVHLVSQTFNSDGPTAVLQYTMATVVGRLLTMLCDSRRAVAKFLGSHSVSVRASCNSRRGCQSVSLSLSRVRSV